MAFQMLQKVSHLCKNVPKTGFYMQNFRLAPIFSGLWQCDEYNRNFSSTKPADDKVYELRIYNIHPQYLKPFLGLSADWMHIRTRHSKMIGYWSTELGGINELVHIWEYDSLAERGKVRQSLASDPDWVNNYFSKILPMMDTQENSVISLFPWSPLLKDLPTGGIYELQVFSYQKEDISVWEEKLKQYLTSREKYATLVGAFHNSLAGQVNSSVQLWCYPDLDKAQSKQLAAEADPSFTISRASLFASLSHGHSRILIPQPWSPLK